MKKHTHNNPQIDCPACVKWVKSPLKCLNCGKEMKKAYDQIAKKKTGYLWHCLCTPNLIMSIG